MRDYSTYSFWLEDCGEPLTPRTALQHSIDVDVAILGSGYSGLWTAYYLLLHAPTLRVAILEKEIAGFGASGRNGGWCSPNFPVSPGMVEKRFGAVAARNLLLAMRASVDEVGRVCEDEGIESHFHQGGVLTLARGGHQLPGIRSAFATYQKLGFGDRYQLLNAEQAATRVRATRIAGGLYTRDGASLHPGRLVRGLARAVERRGGRIYEQTPVIEFRPGSLLTAGGEVRAQRAIVLAGEVYMTRFPRVHRTPPGLFPHLAHGTVNRSTVVTNWLAEQREHLLNAQHRSLSDPNAGWAHPLRQPRCSLRFRLENYRCTGYPSGHRRHDSQLACGVVSPTC